MVRSKCVKACSTLRSGCGLRGRRSAAADEGRGRRRVANSGRHHRPPHTPLLRPPLEQHRLPASRSATTMNARRRARARAHGAARAARAGGRCGARRSPPPADTLAQRLAAHAHGCAEIHDRLRVVADPLLRACSAPPAPTAACRRRATRRAPPQRRSSAPARGARCRRGSASARRGTARGSPRRWSGRFRAGPRPLEAAREFPAVLIADALGGALQVAGARVVAEARPQVQHFVERRGGERAARRESAP